MRCLIQVKSRTQAGQQGDRMNAPATFVTALQVHLPFMTSLAIGLRLGLECQRNPSAKAGLRTCAPVALFATIGGLLAQTNQAPWVVAAGLLLTGAMILAAYAGKTLPEGESAPSP